MTRERDVGLLISHQGEEAGRPRIWHEPPRSDAGLCLLLAIPRITREGLSVLPGWDAKCGGSIDHRQTGQAAASSESFCAACLAAAGPGIQPRKRDFGHTAATGRRQQPGPWQRIRHGGGPVQSLGVSGALLGRVVFIWRGAWTTPRADPVARAGVVGEVLFGAIGRDARRRPKSGIPLEALRRRRIDRNPV